MSRAFYAPQPLGDPRRARGDQARQAWRQAGFDPLLVPGITVYA